MRSSSPRIFAAIVVALALIALDRSPTADAVQATATFTPNPLDILEGGAANLAVSITKDLTATEAADRLIKVDLILPGTLSDTIVDSKSVPVPGSEPGEGQSVSVSATFLLRCDDGMIAGGGSTVASPADLA